MRQESDCGQMALIARLYKQNSSSYAGNGENDGDLSDNTKCSKKISETSQLRPRHQVARRNLLLISP